MVATMQVDYCDYVVGPMFEQLQAVLGDKVRYLNRLLNVANLGKHLLFRAA
eukprot:SAG31_NODE_1844_length_7106_cov_3.064935_6_plen_51_part_00